ncbi:MAG TPA: ABC transporter ATP-binding protein [Capillimicrobium sp.]
MTTTARDPAAPPPPLYDLRAVEKRYGSGDTLVTAVSGVSLRIDDGELVVIAGPSGSGKTTLLQLLGALDRPTGGRLVFEGREVDAMSDRELARLRRETLGFVFQQFNLIPTLTAEQNVEAAMPDRPGAARRERARALLGRVGLAHRLGNLPSQLSGGEQQRVAIARALANEPRLLLADEPTGNLDSDTGEQIMGLLRDLHGDGLTVVLVTHDPEIAGRAPRVVRMRDGRVADAAEAAR